GQNSETDVIGNATSFRELSNRTGHRRSSSQVNESRIPHKPLSEQYWAEAPPFSNPGESRLRLNSGTSQWRSTAGQPRWTLPAGPAIFFALAALAVSARCSAAWGAAPAALPIALDSSPASGVCEANTDRARLAAAAAPSDVDAELKLARELAACRQYPEAIAACRRALAAHPDDRGVQLQIARLLAWDHRYDESISAFRSLLKQHPDDREALEGLARAQVWSGKSADAAVTYRQLAAAHPDSAEYLFEAARLEAETHQYPAARDRLASLLAIQPGNLDARLLLAQLELKQSQYSSALRQFERVLERRPTDPQALMGAAQAHYYTGELAKACAEASTLVAQQPQNFDALFLLASIERAQGHLYKARTLLNRAERLSPHNTEADELREKLRDESSTVLHTTLGYSRETGGPGYSGAAPSPIDEDLRSATYASTLDFTALPHSNSSLSWNALPVESPSGIIAGAAAPREFLYRQTTRVNPRLTLRGGIGIQRFGPGIPVDLPNSAGPQPSATATPVGFIGGTFALSSHFSFDLTHARAGITYTPLAVRLGVVSSRTEGGINITFDPRTALHLTYFREHFTTQPYEQLTGRSDPDTGEAATLDAPLQESGSGGALDFNRRIIDRERFAVDAGYSMTMFGYDGARRGVYLGFFTPNFYERELLNTRFTGHFTRRFGYDFSQGVGVQQVGYHQPFKKALLLNPALTFKATRYVTATIGYTHYDSAQSLGIVRGNGVRLGIDYRLP
ncbi:MAG TPA: tetratricopeptide repeat protein, partial [Terriglobia bacterium]|nr:tetratricopeptide repeat protein [Terriglobia bacterium]